MLRTRTLIVQAFEKAMDEKGFAAVSVRDIVERAGINRATFYDHFDDKFALLNSMIRVAFSRELDRSALRERRPDREALQALILTVCSFVAGFHEHCKPPHDHFDSLMETQVKALTKEVISGWLGAAGSAWRVPASHRDLAANAVSWAIYGLTLSWVQGKRRQAAPAFVRTVLPLAERILGGGQSARRT
ncbi:MAG TPA: TetR/AcrR family transcriptional regulator [Spirochaetia bacterium]|nr:TetR/AcrR family transcriptional regulator [Spirochaetia bacterium]